MPYFDNIFEMKNTKIKYADCVVFQRKDFSFET